MPLVSTKVAIFLFFCLLLKAKGSKKQKVKGSMQAEVALSEKKKRETVGS